MGSNVPMHAVVSTLDEPSRERVEGLWEGIEHEFGIRLGYARPIPHFTWHVAEEYDWDRLGGLLARVGKRHAPFHVIANGIGLFTGRKLVVHVPIVRNDALNELHRDLWQALAPIGTGIVHHFHPELWIPHITLAHAGLTAEVLPHLVTWLADRSFKWDVGIDEIAVIQDHRHDQQLRDHVRLQPHGKAVALRR